MAKSKIQMFATVEEDTDLTIAINTFLNVFNQISWNHSITPTEHKACERLIMDVNRFAHHFGFRDREDY